MKSSVGILLAGVALCSAASLLQAQVTPGVPDAPIAQQAPGSPDHGQVIFSTDHPPPLANPANADVFPKTPVTNEERAAVAIVATDLDLHLVPAEAGIEGRAVLTMRNVSAKPLERVALQLSSSLRWQSLVAAGRHARLTFTQSPVTTDEDHTGYAQEAVLTLERPLSPGATMQLTVLYAGTIRPSAERLTLIGTPADKAALTDWDEIAPTSDESMTGLRGFGEVLWYPVAAPTAVFGEGNELVAGIAAQRRLNAAATMRLRLTVVYAGDPPDEAVFNGEVMPLQKTPDTENQVVDETRGTATAEFALAPIGFRTPSLFLTAQNAQQTGSNLLRVITPVPEAAEGYATAAQSLEPLLRAWVGPDPAGPLTILEHAGEPFEDGAFFAAHLSPSADPRDIAPALVRGLGHAYFHDPAAWSVWLEEGVPELMSLFALERGSGRDAAVAQLEHNATLIALSEPAPAPAGAASGETAPTALVRASADVFVRLKAAAVLWQLRDILGDEAFRTGLLSFRHSLAANAGYDRDQTSFEKTLERTSGRDLGWFFGDWVYQDRGLPDLTITAVDPHAMPARPGKNGGYLVAVVVKNEGDAVAEVPVTVASGGTGAGALTATERLRVAAHSSAATRVLFEGTPETLAVNDGSVPELRTSRHTRVIVLPAAAK